LLTVHVQFYAEAMMLLNFRQLLTKTCWNLVKNSAVIEIFNQKLSVVLQKVFNPFERIQLAHLPNSNQPGFTSGLMISYKPVAWADKNTRPRKLRQNQ
jgi:hypothetical protein